jgi:hypothetical protein
MACGGRGFMAFGEAIWKEEVLLHDGSKIIIKRLYHLGEKPTLASHERKNLDETVTFTLPGTNKEITWKTDFRDEKPEPNNLHLLALDIVNGTPYIVTNPFGCIAYNKWKRPNPPYIFFKYEGNEWKRIPLEEFPTEIYKVNVIVSRPPAELQKSFYTVEQVNLRNHDLEREYKIIVRTPMKGVGCERMVRGQDGWYSIDWFSSQPNHEACSKLCHKENVKNEDCPCESLFKVKIKSE